MATATKVRIKTRMIVVESDTFSSHYDLMGQGEKYRTLPLSTFESESEQRFFADIFSLFGKDNFSDDKDVILANLAKGSIYTPLLQNLGDVPAIAWGENVIPLRVDNPEQVAEGSPVILKLGDALVSVSNGTREIEDEGKKKTISVCNLECSNVVDGEKLMFTLSARLNSAAPDNSALELTEALKDGDFESALPLLATPSKGGGVYVGLKELAQSFKVCGVEQLPKLFLPIVDVTFTENEWNDSGTIKKIRSLSMKIDPQFIPADGCLIKWKDKATNQSRLFYVPADSISGFQAADSHVAYKTIQAKMGWNVETKTFDSAKEQAFREAMAQGKVLLNIFAYNEKNSSYVPHHTVYVNHASFSAKADFSAMQESCFDDYPELPGRDSMTEETTIPASTTTVPIDSPEAIQEAIANVNTEDQGF